METAIERSKYWRESLEIRCEEIWPWNSLSLVIKIDLKARYTLAASIKDVQGKFRLKISLFSLHWLFKRFFTQKTLEFRGFLPPFISILDAPLSIKVEFGFIPICQGFSRDFRRICSKSEEIEALTSLFRVENGLISIQKRFLIKFNSNLPLNSTQIHREHN